MTFAKISKKHFIIGLVLLLFLPISAEWRLLLFGNSVEGVVVPYNPKKDSRVLKIGSRHDYAVAFIADGVIHRANIANSTSLMYGQKLPVKFFHYNPEQNIVIHYKGIYVGWNLVFTLILMLFWASAYWSLNK